MSHTPAKATLQRIARTAYDPVSPPHIDGYTLISSTPTLRFYKKDTTILVGVRGTSPTSPDDLAADASMALGILPSTTRFKQDLFAIQQVQVQYPTNTFTYIGAGHSLGGALIDEFLKMGVLQSGLSYNPAISPGNLQSNLPHHRIYNEADPLYTLMGKHTKGVEVRKHTTNLWKELIAAIPYLGKAYKAFDAHRLDQFVGGIKQSTKNVLFNQYVDTTRQYDWSNTTQMIRNMRNVLSFLRARNILNENDRRILGPLIAEVTHLVDEVEEGGERSLALPPTPTMRSLHLKYRGLINCLANIRVEPETARLGRGSTTTFAKQLNDAGLSEGVYLKEVRKRAKANGYNPKDVEFANDGIHKISIKKPTGGHTKFGKVGYGDHILYSWLESQGKVKQGTAKSKQNRFVKSHSAMKGKWRDDDYSANWLSIRLLW